MQQGYVACNGAARPDWRVDVSTDEKTGLARGRGWAARCGALAAASLALAACQPAVLYPAGPIASAQRTILIDSLLIMMAIVGPTILATLAFAWWFRASNPKARHLPDWAYSGRIELVTWSVPLLTIMLLGGVVWVGSHELDPAQPIASKTKPLDVQVVALDWKWLFIYPEQRVASVNMLMIPAGQPVRFQITSASVLNTFFIPQLGSMIYAMNGMAVELNLQADQPGPLWGQSSHFSGDGFSDMHFEVRALTAADFAGWVENTRKDGPVLDDASYAELAKQSIKVSPYTYRDAEDKLFDKVLSQKLAPGPGPKDSGGGQAGQASLDTKAGPTRTAQADPAICTTGEQ